MPQDIEAVSTLTRKKGYRLMQKTKDSNHESPQLYNDSDSSDDNSYDNLDDALGDNLNDNLYYDLYGRRYQSLAQSARQKSIQLKNPKSQTYGKISKRHMREGRMTLASYIQMS